MKLRDNWSWPAALFFLAGALAAPASATSEPGAPVLNSVTRAADGSLRVDIRWTPPASDGGSPITSYSFYAVDSKGRFGWGILAKDATSPITLVVRACGEPTTWTMHADNYFSVPEGPPSNSITFTAAPGGVCPIPDPVLTAAPVVTVLNPGADYTKLTWTVPPGTVRGYTVRYRSQGQITGSGDVATNAATVHCMDVAVTVFATNGSGPGPESNIVVPTCATSTPVPTSPTPVATVNGWTQIGAGMTFTSASIGSASNAWGTKAGGQIYKWTGTSWTQMPGAAVSTAVGADGAAWVLNSADQIYRWNGSNWNQIPGALRRISVGNATNVWGANAGGQIYKWTGTGWTQMPGAAVSTAVGADGAAWVLNSADQIYRWNGSNWTRMPGALRWISVGGATNVWGVNAGGSVYKFNAATGGWDMPAVPSGTFIGVNTASDGTTLLLRSDGTLWKK